MKKHILISQAIIHDKSRNEISDNLDTRLVDFFLKLNYNPLTISNSYKSPDSLLKTLNLSAIILSGGANFGKFPKRDNLEKALISYSIRKKIPLIGICRGMQMINKFFNGKLIKIDHHVKKNHLIRDVKNNRKIIVNSYHNYAISEKTIHKDLLILFRCLKDRSIEAFKHRKYKILGIMWHPEREKKFKNYDKRFIKKFLNND